EAPENRPHGELSERVIERIKERLPNKPIRYVTFSHHHTDHGSGLRAYIAEGTTVITTSGNKQFVESLATAKFGLKPDALARTPRQPKFEIIANKKHVIRDAHHVVELYDVGPYWHANEEVLVYLPQEKLLFEGDLFGSGSGEDVEPAQDNLVFLAEKIKELGLDVQQFAGVHGRLRPIADIHKSLEKRRLKNSQGNSPAQTGSNTSSTTREYCANVGPVSLTFDDTIVTGRYQITVSPQPINGTIKGTLKEGLLDAMWTDSDGTGRIIFGFISDLSRFGAFYNTQKNPGHWFDGWKAVEKSKISAASAEQQRSLRCDWQ
ncbi:MAG TPA: MBL fold metallo-hydrolase, partial [Blastocatellia bacterium]|nr:MBL fold metallo-hydrolase [Blastocatellia bacterium]